MRNIQYGDLRVDIGDLGERRQPLATEILTKMGTMMMAFLERSTVMSRTTSSCMCKGAKVLRQ